MKILFRRYKESLKADNIFHHYKDSLAADLWAYNCSFQRRKEVYQRQKNFLHKGISNGGPFFLLIK